MNWQTHLLRKTPRKTLGLLGSLCGSLIVALPTASFASPAKSNMLNPCPKIYYEEPYNSIKLVPVGCPANAATQMLSEQTQLPRQQMIRLPVGRPLPIAQPPLPENRSEAIANITPAAGKVGVRLKNNTNAIISYEAIGYTQRRLLAAGAETTLMLPTPATITMVRQDKGLLEVMPMPTNQSGMLAVSLDETTTLSNNQGVLRIQSDGQVFLN